MAVEVGATHSGRSGCACELPGRGAAFRTEGFQRWGHLHRRLRAQPWQSASDSGGRPPGQLGAHSGCVPATPLQPDCGLVARLCRCFRRVPTLWSVTGLYPAGEEPLPGVSGRLVAEAVSAAHPALPVEYAESRPELVAVLDADAPPGRPVPDNERGRPDDASKRPFGDGRREDPNEEPSREPSRSQAADGAPLTPGDRLPARISGLRVDPRFRRRWAEARRAEGRRRLRVLVVLLAWSS